MDNLDTTSLCFTAYDYQRIFIISSALIALGLGGCASSASHHSSSELVKPPRHDITDVELAEIPILTAREAPIVAAALSDGAATPYIAREAAVSGAMAYKAKVVRKACRAKDRFDRGEALAYEWGENRMGFDVDGLDLMSGGMEIEEIKFSYRLKLQEHKTKKERCRYKSSWQGLLGSGYNELVVRETDTVWQELEALENQYAPW